MGILFIVAVWICVSERLWEDVRIFAIVWEARVVPGWLVVKL